MTTPSGWGFLTLQPDSGQHFGLGDTERIDQVVIEWPSGERTEPGNLSVDRCHRIREGTGLVADAR